MVDLPANEIARAIVPDAGVLQLGQEADTARGVDAEPQARALRNLGLRLGLTGPEGIIHELETCALVDGEVEPIREPERVVEMAIPGDVLGVQDGVGRLGGLEDGRGGRIRRRQRRDRCECKRKRASGD